MEITNKLPTVLSFLSHLRIDQKTVLKACTKSVRAYFGRDTLAVQYLACELSGRTSHIPLKGKLPKKIARICRMALVLDLLMSFYSPCDVAEKSFVYPLFFYGGQLLKLEGVFKPLTADRPSDIRHAAIPLLFMAAKMVRLAARGFRGCALLSVYVHTKLLSPAPFGAPETPAAIVAHVAEAQEEELHLVTQANELSLAQKALITRLSVLSSDKRQAVCALVERVQAALADPATEERFRSLVLQQREIEQARALVSNLRVRLHRLSTASTAEIERMEQKRTQGSLNG